MEQTQRPSSSGWKDRRTQPPILRPTWPIDFMRTHPVAMAKIGSLRRARIRIVYSAFAPLRALAYDLVARTTKGHSRAGGLFGYVLRFNTF